MVKSIGDEYSWAKECLLDLKNDGIEVDYVVTDPDSSTYKAAKDLLHDNITKEKPEHFIDTLHLSKNFVEGFNRSLRRSIPSNVTFKKNVGDHAHSAVHSVNFGPGLSILELCSHFHCEIPIGSFADKALKSIQIIDIM